MSCACDNPVRRFRNGWNDLGGGVRVWVSGDVPTSVSSSGGLQGKALARRVSEWLGIAVYLSNARFENGTYRADVSIDPLVRDNPRRVAGLEKAVEDMRLYLGAVDFTSVRDQDRIYQRTMRGVRAVAAKTGLTVAGAWDQIAREAQRRGIVRPVPGKHYDNSWARVFG